MKTSSFFLIVAASLGLLAVNLHSQAPVAKPPMEQLKALKAKNVTLIEQQKQTLLKLDEIAKQAEQIRFLAKRS